MLRICNQFKIRNQWLEIVLFPSLIAIGFNGPEIQGSLVFDVNTSCVGKCRKFELLIDHVLFHRQLYLVVLVGCRVGRALIPLGVPKETIENFRVLSDLRFAVHKKARRILVNSALFFGHDARIILLLAPARPLRAPLWDRLSRSARFSSRLDSPRIHSGYCLI